MPDLLITVWAFVLLDVTPSARIQDPVSPTGAGNGFAAGILGGFFGLGLLIVAMLFISLKPKRHDPRDTPPPRPRPR